MGVFDRGSCWAEWKVEDLEHRQFLWTGEILLSSDRSQGREREFQE